MSYHVFFAFSTGLKEPITAPKGTLASILRHVESVEETLGLKRSQYMDNPVHWDTWDENYRLGFPHVDDETLCKTVLEHNAWVRRLYADIAKWASDPVADGETITAEDAQTFWHGLQMLRVKPDRWTGEYYRSRMEHYYEVMRGREDEGVSWPAPKLSPKQAGAVIWLLADLLDHDDIRLEVARGNDHLSSGDEYTWCSKCGAVTDEDANACRKRDCKASSRDCPKCNGWGRIEKGEREIECPKCDGQGTVYA